ncbi:MAG: DUF4199 domain-containing protein [Sphingobacteriia bacterium]|nr:MAG: DUF4199 domain-containing protein [Sphingobacteriia bacterium]TAG32212.1 MAG: DUF4199 domain-containing protein [Sphingobacteriia bacterium]
MKVNLINEGLKYGLICGIAALLLMFGSWASGDAVYANVQMYGTFVPYMFGIILFVAFTIRKQNGGFISFAEVLKFSFLAFSVSAVIVGIGNLVLLNLIDKGLSERMAEIGLEKTRQMMEKFGASEEDIEKSMASTQASMKDTGPKKIFLGTGITIVLGFVEALIISIIAKKDEKFQDQ